MSSDWITCSQDSRRPTSYDWIGHLNSPPHYSDC